MKPNAWTGSAWGKGPATPNDDQDYEGDDACGICLNAPEAVSLQPCKHKICAGCVDRLRYQLISTVGWCMMQHMSSVCGAYKTTGFDNDMHASNDCRRRAVSNALSAAALCQTTRMLQSERHDV